MFKRYYPLVLTAVVVGMWAGMAGSRAHAADQPAAPNPIGVVDMEKVSDEAVPYKDANKELQQLQDSLNQNMQEISSYTYLTSTELNEVALYLDAKELTATQKARMAELKKFAADREAEWNKLAQTPSPDAAQKKRIGELTQMRTGREQILNDVNTKYQTAFRTKLQEVDARLGKMVGEVVNEVAKAQKLSVVLSKSVVITMDRKQDVVFFGGNDITDEVIKRLNAKK